MTWSTGQVSVSIRAASASQLVFSYSFALTDWRTSTFSAGAADIDILPHPLTDYPDGMLQNGTDWADGVPGVTQCPIPAKSSFTYQFKVSDQYGTYWYHSHMGNTMADGLFVSCLALHELFPG